ncbi:hypothetical protein IFM89_011284 [Coptis chinensis]|uniref:Trichome birefringence-like C-terminal domain-containing protein n=1 Tax=Coptis chinensis TaxID=261450 RepID=A0A835HVF1_9MAGN|nr:hypothetical protein IFM89_011284 [Coptis chinensis]
MWACRLTQRTDFSYETFKWQPENCRMPEFEKTTFLRRMQDKTIAFVGDSLGRQQFQSLICMVTGGEEIPDVHNIGSHYGLVKARGAIRPDCWAYRFRAAIQPFFITGHHWNKGKLVGNCWVMYVDGRPNNDKKLAEMANAKKFTVHSVVKWLDSQLLQQPQLRAFFWTISPRHFFNGDWNTGGTCDNSIPLAGGSEVLQDESSDPVIESAVKGLKVKILDSTAISQLRDEGHLSKYTIRPTEGMQDCLHWCLPGIP